MNKYGNDKNMINALLLVLQKRNLTIIVLKKGICAPVLTSFHK